MQKQRSTSSRTKGKNRGPAYRSRKGEKEKAEKEKAKTPERGRDEQKRGRIALHLWRRLRVSIQ